MKTKLIVLVLLIISATAFAQNGEKTIDSAFELLKAQKDISYFEVTGEMFKMLSETKETTDEFKDYMRQLTGMKMVRNYNRHDNGAPDIYKLFMQNTNLKGFSRLMTSETSTRKISFYQKKSKAGNEYLLVQSSAVIYITGTIDLKSISEFEQVMNIAGSAFDM